MSYGNVGRLAPREAQEAHVLRLLGGWKVEGLSGDRDVIEIGVNDVIGGDVIPLVGLVQVPAPRGEPAGVFREDDASGWKHNGATRDIRTGARAARSDVVHESQQEEMC